MWRRSNEDEGAEPRGTPRARSLVLSILTERRAHKVMQLRARSGMLQRLTPEVLATVPDPALRRAKRHEAAGDRERTSSSPQHYPTRPAALCESAEPSASKDDPGHHRGIAIPVRRQGDADPHQSEVGGRYQQVGHQGRRQPGPFLPLPGSTAAVASTTPASHAAKRGVWKSPSSGRG